MEICNCGLIKQNKAGTYPDADGVQRCNRCQKPIEFDLKGVRPQELRVAPNMMTTLAVPPGFRTVKSHGVVTELAATSGFTATSKDNTALDSAMASLGRAAGALGANAIVGSTSSVFGAAGGITSAVGGDAVGVLLMGTAVTVELDSPPLRPSSDGA